MPTSPSSLRFADGLSREFLLHHRVCPLSLGDAGDLDVAVAPDAALDAVDEVAFAYRPRVRSVRTTDCSSQELEQLVERLTTATEREIELSRGDSA